MGGWFPTVVIIRVSHLSLAAVGAGADLVNKILNMEAVKWHDILRTVQYFKKTRLITMRFNPEYVEFVLLLL